jgi:uncharacterized protein (UPF0212 family)
MRVLTATDLLGAWEQGLSQSAVRRALTLLTLASSEAGPESPAQLSIGQRDAHLLALRERAFGPRMTGLATCPACGAQVQLDFTVADVRVAGPSVSVDPCTLSFGELDVSFRLPNSQDLLALPTPGDGSSSSSRRALLERCLLSARRNGQDIPAEELSEEVATAISQRMAEVDPQADVQLTPTCPQCGQGWQAPLDIASFLWSEIHAWAVRLLRDVHTLASAYGWREAEILALSPWRRQAYLELVGQ